MSEKGITKFHPCTVMEYENGGMQFYDFVYVTVRSWIKEDRKALESFFEEYKRRDGRFGRYLLSADISEPLWEAEYDSPATLLRAEPGARSQLELLQARVRGACFNEKRLEEIAELLVLRYDGVSLQRLSSSIQLEPKLWHKDGVTATTNVADLLAACLARNKVEELLDAMGRDYPLV